MSNYDYLSLVALLSLQGERDHHASVHAQARSRRR